MGQFVPERPGLTPANLKIYCRNQPSQEIVAATCLALGDMSFTLKKQSTVSTDMIRDSWRVFTRSYFLDKAYSNIGALDKLHPAASGMAGYAPDKFNMQSWSASVGSTRTPLFIDAFDTFNQYLYYQSDWSGFLPVDWISIDDFSVIEETAYRSTDLEHVEYLLKSKSSQYGYTYDDVDRLMVAYERCEQ